MPSRKHLHSKVANGPASGSVAGITYCFVRALTFQGQVELHYRTKKTSIYGGLEKEALLMAFERSFGHFEVDNSTSFTYHQILGRMVQLKRT